MAKLSFLALSLILFFLDHFPSANPRSIPPIQLHGPSECSVRPSCQPGKACPQWIILGCDHYFGPDTYCFCPPGVPLSDPRRGPYSKGHHPHATGPISSSGEPREAVYKIGGVIDEKVARNNSAAEGDAEPKGELEPRAPGGIGGGIGKAAAVPIAKVIGIVAKTVLLTGVSAMQQIGKSLPATELIGQAAFRGASEIFTGAEHALDALFEREIQL